VRLPRDWLGPRDELVPFGPRADPPASPPSADDFWGEKSDAVQLAVQGPERSSPAVVQASSDEAGRENERYEPFLDRARRSCRQLASTVRGGRTAAAALAVLALVGAAVAIAASPGGVPNGGSATAHDGSRFVEAVLAAAASRVRVPTLVQLPAHRPVVRQSARARHRRPVHHAGTASAVQVAAVSHHSTVASAAPSAAASYGRQGSGSSYVSPPATSNAKAATSTPSPSAASQSQPAGPTGPGAILGPGHCSC
jgi:hypothetical protein